MIGRAGKIAFVIHSLKMGGSEKFFITLVNSFYHRGYDPLVILLEPDNPLIHALDKGITCLIITRKARYDLSVSFRIRDALMAHSVQNIFCVEPYAFFLSKLALFKNKRFRFFLSLHNSLPIGMKKYLLETSYLRLFEKNDIAIFICNYQREYFRSHYLFRPARSWVIYNGVNTAHFSPEAASCQLDPDLHAWRQKKGIADSDKVMLMVGRISPEKGHKYAVKALKHLHDMKMPLHLVIVGYGSQVLQDELRCQAVSSGLENHVHFEGGQSEVRHYLMHADGFVMTSVSETFSLAALEALSMGTPCSLTRIGGAAEMITGSEMGELCESGDTMSIAMSWKDLIQRKRDRSKIRSMALQHFSDKIMLDQYEQILFTDEERKTG